VQVHIDTFLKASCSLFPSHLKVSSLTKRLWLQSTVGRSGSVGRVVLRTKQHRLEGNKVPVDLEGIHQLTSLVAKWVGVSSRYSQLKELCYCTV
jgi:hypothetical protein